MNATVLVTGATGIAGAHVADVLRTAGARVLRLSREERDGWVTADLTDPEAVARLPDFDAVVHCAALTPRSGVRERTAYDAANVTTTSVLAAEAAGRGVRRFVFVSTMGRAEQQDDLPGRYYVASKHEAERRLGEATVGKVPSWIVRPASLYGEHDRGSMATLIRGVARGRFVALGDLGHRKCLLYAGTLAALIASELEQEAHAEVRTETAHDLAVHRFGEVLTAVESAVGRRAPRVPMPGPLVRGGLRAARAGTELAGVHAASRVFGAAAVAMRDVPCEGDNAVVRVADRAVGLGEGVRREVEWLRAHGGI